MKQIDMSVPCGEGIINIRVGAIIMRGDRFLMVHNDQSDYYYSVGGRIKFGETAEEAVVREVYEETGVKMDIDHLGFIHENYFMGDSIKGLGKVYYELAFYFYMKVPDSFEPNMISTMENGFKEYLTWIGKDEPRVIYPDFLRKDLDPSKHDVKHIVTDDRVICRKAKESDLESLYQLLSDPEVMKYLEPPFTFEQARDFLDEQGLVQEPRILIVEDGKQAFLGYVIYHDYDEDNKEIGWVLKKEAWGKGLAGNLTRQLVAKASLEGKHCIIECVPEQTATKIIALNNGFKVIGYHDHLIIYQRKMRNLLF